MAVQAKLAGQPHSAVPLRRWCITTSSLHTFGRSSWQETSIRGYEYKLTTIEMPGCSTRRVALMLEGTAPARGAHRPVDSIRQRGASLECLHATTRLLRYRLFLTFSVHDCGDPPQYLAAAYRLAQATKALLSPSGKYFQVGSFLTFVTPLFTALLLARNK